jgi:hypothetical protein
MKRDPWKRFRVNTPEERMIYLAGWFYGYARRMGIPKAKLKLEEHPEKDEIRQMMRKVR